MNKHSALVVISLILISIGILWGLGCQNKKIQNDQNWVFTDTVRVPNKDLGVDTIITADSDTVTVDSFLVWVSNRFDSLESVIHKQKNTIRSKDSALFEARFKLARVWYYDSLCLKNSRLDKYLKGWIRRALEK